TLSRDLKELAVLKTPSGYVVADEETARADTERREDKLDRLDRALREFVSSVEAAGTMVVIKTPPAGAHPIAHHIDEADLPEVAGTIAGENTVFLAAYSAAAAQKVARRLLAPIAPSASAPSPRARRPRA